MRSEGGRRKEGGLYTQDNLFCSGSLGTLHSFQVLAIFISKINNLFFGRQPILESSFCLRSVF